MTSATTPQALKPRLTVAMLTRYAQLGASSRVRFFQFAPWLERRGIALQAFPLFDDGYLRTLYAHGTRRRADVLRAYAGRLLACRRAADHDLVWIEKELFPYWPYGLERMTWPRSRPTVVDYDDAVFHNYDLSAHRAVRALLGRKIDRIMAAADLVVCGNRYLADRARLAGSRRCEIVPTVVDMDCYPVPDTKASQPLVIGWIGSPATERYVFALRQTLQRLCKTGHARVVLIGASARALDALQGVPVEIVAWQESTEQAQIARFDIGIMPLPDEPWERGKCGYKLIQYMASGLPVVASPVGANREIVTPGVHGLMPTTADEWQAALQTLMDDAGLRAIMGATGRQRVLEHYSLQAHGDRLAELLLSTAGSR
jgi:glycosyltransferase involved in cell wall biosynthesis